MIVGNEHDHRRRTAAYHRARLKTETTKEDYMNRVDTAAERYLTRWNSMHEQVNDRGIVRYGIKEAMRDIEQWIEGRDPNGARDIAGMVDWSRDELISLYRALSPTAAFFEYTVRDYRGTDGPP